MPATTKKTKGEESNFKIVLADKPGKFKPVAPRHKLGVLVPYRDRLEELLIFVPHMSKFLNKQNITFHIYVINQVDLHRFNRAALLNAGFLFAANESCDYIAMHDVDLLPLNNDLNYGYPSEGPFHVSSPSLHPKYHYAKFIGGIMLMSNEQFRKVNGLSTQFWGWGREDDELYMRIQDEKLRIMQPVGIKTGYKTFMHNHEKKRKRDYPTSRKQYKAGFNRDNKTGLNTMDHKVLSRHEMTIEGYPVSMIAVQLKCKYEVTPWCDN
ncbi:beta-1,4-galactosyltransferase 7-like isoform X2 [Dendronephthya gigantea]|nr:beta-1,4-galactosyltransferase 7-like isoform X2 [Dendronephthya gigantea]